MSIEHARETLDAEIKALQIVKDNLDGQFIAALDAMEKCTGRVIVSGMGKAGLIGQKIAATLASTGTPAFFMHPAEALHGDLGMITSSDVCLFLSNSGESDEITSLLPFVRRIGCTVIGITGNARSTMAAHCEIIICLGAIHEACPLGLAPTATTTAILAVGDALAMSLMQRKGFRENDFARIHPAGALGRKVAPVDVMMRIGDAVAKVACDATVMDTLLAMSQARAGAAVVVDADGRLEGIFCDGDLRRGVEAEPGFLSEKVGNVMIRGCRKVTSGALAGDVLNMMREYRIADIPVVDADDVVIGLADLKGLIASL